MNSLLLLCQLIFDDLGVALLSESVTEAGYNDRGRGQLTVSYMREEKGAPTQSSLNIS